MREPAQVPVAGHGFVQHSPPQVPDVKGEDSLVERRPLGTAPLVRWLHGPPGCVWTEDEGEEVESKSSWYNTCLSVTQNGTLGITERRLMLRGAGSWGGTRGMGPMNNSDGEA